MRAGPAAGIVVMLFAMTLLPIMDAVSKLLTSHYGPIQITWVRNVVHIALVAPIALALHGKNALHTPSMVLQIARCLLMTLMAILYVQALQLMPLANALAVVFIFPCVVAALSPVLLGEVVGVRRWVAVCVGFLGASLVIRPGGDIVNSGGIFALGAALAYAGYILLTRKLSASVSPLVMLLYIGIVGVVGAGVIVPFDWRPLRLEDVSAFVGVGVLAVMAHLLIILAYRWAEASLVAPLAYVQIVGGTILGFILFGDFPEPLTWVGIALIIASGVYVAWREGKLAVRRSRHD